MRLKTLFSGSLLAGLAVGAVGPATTGVARGAPGTAPLIYADQGAEWTDEARGQFYGQDQGAQMMPYAWLQALKLPDGKPFLDGDLTRYGYLPTDHPAAAGLPVGFTLAASSAGPMTGMTCSACHTRQIAVAGQPIRIDGGPAFADFGRFLIDLDTATTSVLATPGTFDAFAAQVLGASAKDDAKAVLRADLTVWSTRYHLIISRSVANDRIWGPARLDAVSMILNRVAGLDIGTPPTYAIPDNIAVADAPTRYPFLWNASRQDHTQWPGFAANGNDFFALARNLGEVYGVFGLYHPELGTGSVATLFNRNFLLHNSGNFAGLQSLEQLIKRIGPPAFQWPVDQALAARGKTIYTDVKTGIANKSCNDCHGINVDFFRIEHFENWKTPIQNVGTDRAEWRVLGRSVATGSLEGAEIPLVSPALLKKDLAVSVLKISVVGALGEQGVSSVNSDFRATVPASVVLRGAAPAGVSSIQAIPGAASPDAAPAPVTSVVASQTATATTLQLNSLFRVPGMRVAGVAAEAPVVYAYESRVMQGVWAAAPFLHNGSVPTLADLLKPAAQRPKSFAVGPAYDIATLGLATEQPGSTYTLQTTGCDDLMSGNSNCGHEYGTGLSEQDKKALLEYMKTL